MTWRRNPLIVESAMNLDPKSLLAKLPDKEAWLARSERIGAACRELGLREYCLLGATAALLLFTGASARALRRMSAVLEKQQALLESASRSEEARRETERALAWARLRASIWTVMDLLRVSQIDPDGVEPPRERVYVLLQQARRVLEGEELNPVLAADAEALASWRDALATARLAEGALGAAEAQAGFFAMQASRVSQGVANVWSRLAPSAGEGGSPILPLPAPAASSATPPDAGAAAPGAPAPAGSPLPKPPKDEVPSPRRP